SHPSSLTRIVGVGPAQLSVAYLEKTFWKRRAVDPTNSIWEGRTCAHGTTHAEAVVSECGTCVAYFKRRWTNVTNVKKKKILDRPRSEAAHRELSRFSRLPTPGLYRVCNCVCVCVCVCVYLYSYMWEY